MKINSVQNTNFGLKITPNETFSNITGLWAEKYPLKVIQKAVRKMEKCAPDTFEVTFVNKLSPTTMRMNADFSYKGAFTERSTVGVLQRKAKVNPDAVEGAYEVAHPSDVAKDFIQEVKFYKKSLKRLLA